MVFKLRRHAAWLRGLPLAAAIAAFAFAPAPVRAQNAVQFWNQTLLTVTQQTSALLTAGPPDVALQMAIMDNAMYDAVNAATGGGYKPYAYTGGAVSGVSAEAAALSAGYTALSGYFGRSEWAGSTNAATNTRINDVILPELLAAYNARKALLAPSQAVTDGLTLGIAAGNAMLDARATDGSGAAIVDGLLNNVPVGSGITPGVYVPPSASGGRPEMYPLWGSVTPVGSPVDQFQAIMASVRLPGVTNFSASPFDQVQEAVASAAYAAELMRTECGGSGSALTGTVAAACTAAGIAPQTLAQSRAALFWNDPGTTIQPPGHWLQIANTVMVAQGLDLMQQARLSATMSTAIADAGIAAWGEKYIYNLWRPITAIRDCTAVTGAYSWNSTLTTANAGSQGSCSNSWVSLIATPPHPDYIAGHPSFSGAAATVLASFFGNDNISFASQSNAYCNGGSAGFAADGYTIVSCTLDAGQAAASGVYAAGTYTTCNSISLSSGASNVNDSPLVCAMTLSFDSFSEASSGVIGSTYSRVAGGIHTPFASTDALAVGNSIGALVFANNFTAVPESSSLMVLSVAAFGLAGAARRRRGSSYGIDAGAIRR